MAGVGDGRSTRHDTMGRHKEGGRRPSEGGSPSTVVAMTTQARRRKCGQEKGSVVKTSYNLVTTSQRFSRGSAIPTAVSAPTPSYLSIHEVNTLVAGGSVISTAALAARRGWYHPGPTLRRAQPTTPRTRA